MEDVVLGIILLIILVSVYKGTPSMTAPTRGLSEDPFATYDICTQEPSSEFNFRGVQDCQSIFSDVVKLYDSQIDNKRELIVHQLHKISEFVDTDTFFDEYPYIHEYIFKI